MTRKRCKFPVAPRVLSHSVALFLEWEKTQIVCLMVDRGKTARRMINLTLLSGTAETSMAALVSYFNAQLLSPFGFRLSAFAFLRLLVARGTTAAWLANLTSSGWSALSKRPPYPWPSHHGATRLSRNQRHEADPARARWTGKTPGAEHRGQSRPRFPDAPLVRSRASRGEPGLTRAGRVKPGRGRPRRTVTFSETKGTGWDRTATLPHCGRQGAAGRQPLLK